MQELLCKFDWAADYAVTVWAQAAEANSGGGGGGNGNKNIKKNLLTLGQKRKIHRALIVRRTVIDGLFECTKYGRKCSQQILTEC